MQRIIVATLLGWACLGFAHANERIALEHLTIDIHDNAALTRGAKIFVNYCTGCHAATAMRYARIARDLGLSEDAMYKGGYLYATHKLGDPMNVALLHKDATNWLGVAPPDLSTIARYRGTDWLYTYLRAFYSDPARATGVNNRVFKDVAMPNVLWELQGIQTLNPDDHGGKLTLTRPGRLSQEGFDHTVSDLVHFLAYMGEPAQLERARIAPWVLGYLALLLVVLYLLKKEYWKDVR
ncbi:MAG: cytochrome c1 [Pseudomonadota bacterium]